MEVEQVFARFRDIKHGTKAKKKATSIHYGEHKSGFIGAGYDVVGVDEWRQGQPLKDIAWSLSLRTFPDKIFKIERMEPKELRTLLVVDLSYSTLFQISQESNKALLMLDLIGNIGLTRANVRDPVGLLAFSDQVELFVKPRLGASQVFYMAYQIFEKLKLQREFPTKRRADFSVPFHFMAARLKTRHSVIMISDLVDMINDRESIDFKRLRMLSSKHDMIMLILDDPQEFRVRSPLGYIRISDMETGKQTVISARKVKAIRRRIEESRDALQYELKRQSGIDSVVLTPENHSAAPREVPDIPNGPVSAPGHERIMKRTRIFAGLIVAVVVALLSLATQVTAQPQPEPANEPDAASPVQIETLDLEPTVVKTGDLITQTYRVRFPDLISEGKEIIILEDRMVPENLPVHPFEAVSLDVRKRQIEDEQIWDFVFGFRLIEPEKATYVLPAFSFFYLVRDLGEDVEGRGGAPGRRWRWSRPLRHDAYRYSDHRHPGHDRARELRHTGNRVPHTWMDCRATPAADLVDHAGQVGETTDHRLGDPAAGGG